MIEHPMDTVGDVLSVGLIIGWMTSALPAIATLLTIIWMVIRIYETKTVQKWLGHKVEKDNEPTL